MPRTKFKYENKQRAITQKLSKRELWFLCIALPLERSIHQQNFITIASIVLDILRTKFKYENKQRAITQKLSK